tara:strand:- start:106 stop:981 length:876 start_codon:yes stop_codon:yes gene_type:complete
MDFNNLLSKINIGNFPVGIGGCKSNETTYDCCEYDITIFDGKKENETVINFENELVKIHHGNLNEADAKTLKQFENLKILHDEKWDLRMLQSKIKEKNEQITKASAKSCLIDASVCITKSNSSLKNSEPFSSSWLKSAAYFLADAICLLNLERPSPTHSLQSIRKFNTNKFHQSISTLIEIIGLERATTSLLSRMCKSTIGFSDMVEKNGNSKIIQRKYEYLTEKSLLSDCYFYFGYINRNNFIKIKNDIAKKPELIHILKTAFDLENDPVKLDSQVKKLQNAVNSLLEHA